MQKLNVCRAGALRQDSSLMQKVSEALEQIASRLGSNGEYIGVHVLKRFSLTTSIRHGKGREATRQSSSCARWR